MTLALDSFAQASPGQFVHLGVDRTTTNGFRSSEAKAQAASLLLRRAFSIAGLRRTAGGVELDVIFRVVGTGTRWLASLGRHSAVSVLGPVGSSFPISSVKPHAWMVAGGVGLPPMLWLARALQRAHRHRVAFCGARCAELLPLTWIPDVVPDEGANRAVLGASEFAESDTPVVVSTDDGSLGFFGNVGAAMARYHQSGDVRCDSLVVYACGPEPMLAAIAGYCRDRGIECYVCLERAMACGIGTCQSCVVPVVDDRDADGWRYALCCTEGPVFEANQVLWHRP